MTTTVLMGQADAVRYDELVEDAIRSSQVENGAVLGYVVQIFKDSVYIGSVVSIYREYYESVGNIIPTQEVYIYVDDQWNESILPRFSDLYKHLRTLGFNNQTMEFKKYRISSTGLLELVASYLGNTSTW